MAFKYTATRITGTEYSVTTSVQDRKRSLPVTGTPAKRAKKADKPKQPDMNDVIKLLGELPEGAEAIEADRGEGVNSKDILRYQQELGISKIQFLSCKFIVNFCSPDRYRLKYQEYLASLQQSVFEQQPVNPEEMTATAPLSSTPSSTQTVKPPAVISSFSFYSTPDSGALPPLFNTNELFNFSE